MSTRNTPPKVTASALDSRQPEWVSRACALLDGGEAPIPLIDLAQVCGVSASHLQRVFKASTGLTPKQYAMARQRERAQAALQQGEAVTDAWITTKVKAELATADGVKSTRVSVETNDGVVTLTGVLPTQTAVQKAETVARAVKGVKKVEEAAKEK